MIFRHLTLIYHLIHTLSGLMCNLHQNPKLKLAIILAKINIFYALRNPVFEISMKKEEKVKMSP